MTTFTSGKASSPMMIRGGYRRQLADEPIRHAFDRSPIFEQRQAPARVALPA
jgi:hypothetical protein